MRSFVFLFLLSLTLSVQAQFSFELKVDYAMRVGNTDQFSVSGTLQSGRIEKGKVYFLDNGSRVEVQNILSGKTATSVPVASSPEQVSLAFTCADYTPGRGDILRGVSTRPQYGQVNLRSAGRQLPEGVLSCRVNGKMYRAKLVSKPVYIRASNILDLFFQAEDESVIWLQLNGFSDISEVPHRTTSDTSQKNLSLLCKVAFMPKGYRPTDMPNQYKAFEDLKGNAGILILSLNRYRKSIGLEFNGTLRPNERLLAENQHAGLFYLTEGRVDEASWDEF